MGSKHAPVAVSDSAQEQNDSKDLDDIPDTDIKARLKALMKLYADYLLNHP